MEKATLNCSAGNRETEKRGTGKRENGLVMETR